MPILAAKPMASHDIDNVVGIEIIKSSKQKNWKNIFVYTAHVQPFNALFPNVDSLLLIMPLEGVLQGIVNIEETTTELNLQTGSIYFFPPGKPLNITVKTYAQIISVFVSKDLLDEVCLELLSSSQALFDLNSSYPIHDDFLTLSMKLIKEHLDTDGQFSSIEVQFIVRSILARIIATFTPAKSDGLNLETGLPIPVLQKVFDYIDANLQNRILIDQLAPMAKVGNAQFARLFKRATNITLHQYIIKQRVQMARHLLIHTQMPIAEIAHECGFADQVHLTRLFGRIIGSSPASFRRKHGHYL